MYIGGLSTAKPMLNIRLSSTFDARPMEYGLRHWLSKLGTQAEVTVAPGCQPITTLLRIDGPSSRAAVTLLTLRIEDLANEQSGSVDELSAAIAVLSDAICGSVHKVGHPHLLAVCPASPSWSTGRRAVAAAAAEAELTQRLSGVAGVHVLSSAQAPAANHAMPGSIRLAGKWAGCPIAPRRISLFRMRSRDGSIRSPTRPTKRWSSIATTRCGVASARKTVPAVSDSTSGIARSRSSRDAQCSPACWSACAVRTCRRMCERSSNTTRRCRSGGTIFAAVRINWLPKSDQSGIARSRTGSRPGRVRLHRRQCR